MCILTKRPLFFPFILSLILTSLLFQSCRDHQTSSSVQLKETKLEITTYLTDTFQINPMFYIPANYQNAQLHIYPYPAIDRLTNKKVQKKHKALILENEYLEICVLPELGGRLYYTKDKTNNNYDFFYHNHVIKPALIGMTGAWLSGGVEWNIPHHHRASTFMPVDYRLVNNADGSKTIWVGEYEKRHQTRWVVGLTLHPGKAYIEADIRTFNVTSQPQSGLVWANAAVHANKDYQVIFAPDVHTVTYHGKTDFSEWPISRQVYRGVDYSSGIDISWWKNTKQPTSFFVLDSDMDFFGGYDHGKDAGTVMVGNHHIIPGKKMWNWGNNEVQRMWDQMLTDVDGPYLELMMGAWSDNQPDYSWMEPFTTRFAKMYFYPVKQLQGIKNANKDFAINLDIDKGKVLIQANATSTCKNCEIILLDGEKELFRNKLNLDPNNPLSTEIHLTKTVDPFNMNLILRSDDGKEILRYAPEKIEKKNFPKPYMPPDEPEEISNVNDLYLKGLRLEQFTNPHFNPDSYYFEAAKHDPNNFLINKQIGMSYLKKMRYQKAENYFRKAVENVTGNYTRPKDCESTFYLGLSLYLQERYTEAYDAFYDAIWNQPCSAQSYFLLAVLDSKQQDYERALEHIELSIQSNGSGTEALLLKAMLLRKKGQQSAAKEVVGNILDLDPLNFGALYESIMLEGEANGVSSSLSKIMRDEPDNYLETSTRYSQAGFFDDAIQLLDYAVHSSNKKLNSYPMIYFYKGYCLDQAGGPDAALDSYKKGIKLPIDYCFPYGNVSAIILKAAADRLPDGANIYYYLGNIYCDYQPELAATYWEKAIQLNDKEAIYHRNLAFVYANALDKTDEAIIEIERAISLNHGDPVYLTEADKLYELTGKSPEFRFKKLQKNLSTIYKSELSLRRYLYLNNYFHQHDTVIKVLNQRHFHVAEGATDNIHTYWSDAYRLKGEALMLEGKPEEAIPLFNKMLEFPRNLETIHDGKAALAYYYLGKAYDMQKQPEKAKGYFKKMADYTPAGGWGEGSWPEVNFYRAKALEALGKKAEARDIYHQLLKRGKNFTDAHTHSARAQLTIRAKNNSIKQRANSFYLQGLGLTGLGRNIKAKIMFDKALQIKPDHFDAKTILESQNMK